MHNEWSFTLELSVFSLDAYRGGRTYWYGMKEDDVSSRLVSRSGPNSLEAGNAGCQIAADSGFVSLRLGLFFWFSREKQTDIYYVFQRTFSVRTITVERARFAPPT